VGNGRKFGVNGSQMGVNERREKEKGKEEDITTQWTPPKLIEDNTQWTLPKLIDKEEEKEEDIKRTQSNLIEKEDITTQKTLPTKIDKEENLKLIEDIRMILKEMYLRLLEIRKSPLPNSVTNIFIPPEKVYTRTFNDIYYFIYYDLYSLILDHYYYLVLSLGVILWGNPVGSGHHNLN